jgi:hypothetical protein
MSTTTTTTAEDMLLTAYFDLSDARRAALRSHDGQGLDSFEETPADAAYDLAFNVFAAICTELGMSPDEGISEARDVIGGRR